MESPGWPELFDDFDSWLDPNLKLAFTMRFLCNLLDHSAVASAVTATYDVNWSAQGEHRPMANEKDAEKVTPRRCVVAKAQRKVELMAHVVPTRAT